MDGDRDPCRDELGIPDPFDMTDDEMAQVKACLASSAPLRFYWTDPTELEQAIAAGEVVAAYAWAASATAR